MLSNKMEKSLAIVLMELKENKFTIKDLTFLGKYFRSLFDVTRALLLKIKQET